MMRNSSSRNPLPADLFPPVLYRSHVQLGARPWLQVRLRLGRFFQVKLSAGRHLRFSFLPSHSLGLSCMLSFSLLPQASQEPFSDVPRKGPGWLAPVRYCELGTSLGSGLPAILLLEAAAFVGSVTAAISGAARPEPSFRVENTPEQLRLPH